MNRYQPRHGDADLLHDGDRIRVSMVAMDSLDPVQRQILAQRGMSDADRAQRAVDLTKQKLAADAHADSYPMHRPGYRVMLTGDAASQALDAVHKARQDYLEDLQNAWRGDKHKPVLDRKDDDDEDDEGEGGNQEGARAGRKKRKTQYRDPSGRESGSSEEWEDRLHRDQQERKRVTDEAYADYAAELESAHRGR
jgi:hypothetical protein